MPRNCSLLAHGPSHFPSNSFPGLNSTFILFQAVLDWEEPGVEQWRERRSYRAAKVFLLMAFLAQWKGRKSWRGRRRQNGEGRFSWKQMFMFHASQSTVQKRCVLKTKDES